MVGIGIAMLAVVICALVLWRRGVLGDVPWFNRLCLIAAPSGFVAVIAGWVTTEVGRQPWVVYGLLRTRDAVTPSLTGNDVLASLVVYVVAYALIFGAGGYFLLRLLKAGLTPAIEHEAHGTPARPLSAVEAE